MAPPSTFSPEQKDLYEALLAALTDSSSSSSTSSTTRNTVNIGSVNASDIGLPGADQSDLLTSIGQPLNGALQKINEYAKISTEAVDFAKRAIGGTASVIYDIQQNIRGDNGILNDIINLRAQLGGISFAELEGETQIENAYTKTLIDNYHDINKLLLGFQGTKADMIGPNGESPLSMIFRTDKEGLKSYLSMIDNIATVTPSVLADLNDKQQEELLIFKQSLNITDEQMTTLLEKQFAFTGETSTKVMEDITNVSLQMAKAVGSTANNMKSDILQISTDINTFGNIGEVAAGRIAASLHSAGLEVENLTSLISKADTFDKAAAMAGDLSAMYGVQIDAMKATYLANEDQEEYFQYIRRQILDANLDIENMSHARQRGMAEELGMRIPQLINFIKTGDRQISESALDAASQQQEGVNGLTNAVDKFADKFSRAAASPAEQFDILQRKIDIDMTQSALSFANTIAEGYQSAFNKIQFPKEAAEIGNKLYEVADSFSETGFEDFVYPFIDGANTLMAGAATSVKGAAEFFGVEFEKVKEDVKIQTFEIIGDNNTNVTNEIMANQSAIVANQAANQATNQQLTSNLATTNTSVLSLVNEMKNASSTVVIELDGQQVAENTAYWWESQGGVIVQAEAR